MSNKRVAKLLERARHPGTPAPEAEACREKAEELRDQLAEADLGELAVLANKFHDEVEDAGRVMGLAAWKAGQTLLTAKEACEHGEWEHWLGANFQATPRTARRYMRVASNWTRMSDLAEVSINQALEAIMNDPSKRKRGKRGGKRTPAQKVVRRINCCLDDFNVIADAVEKDEDDDDGVAGAARACGEGLVELRDGLTKLLQDLGLEVAEF